MRPKSVALLLLALGCGLIASIGITKVMSKWSDQSDNASGEGINVFVAATDIGMGDVLTQAMVKPQEWPKNKIPEGAITELKDVEGRRTRTRLYVGEPILENRLFAPGTSQPSASDMITKGYRIMPVKVDMVSGGSSLILPGDRVDVMVYFIQDSNRHIKETMVRRILQNIKVFAVNDVLDAEKDKEGSKSITAKTISLLVTPKQASILMLATQMGLVNLVLRSPGSEEQQSEIPEARPGELFGELASLAKDKDKGKEEPAPPKAKVPDKAPVVPPPVEKAKPRPTWTIRVLKPNAVEEVKFEQEPTGNPATREWKLSTSVGGASATQPSAKAASGVATPPAPEDLGTLVPSDFQPLDPSNLPKD
jgi:pilus assembly protein CpaB